MTWLLVIFIALPGEPVTKMEIGMINGPGICNLTGRAIMASLVEELPMVRAGFSCVEQVAA